MARKVDVSKKAADDVIALHGDAVKRGLGPSFRRAWITIWNALAQRPLPPDETAEVFGELLYWTKNAPKHAVCIASIAPLSVRFAVSEEEVMIAGTMATAVTILKVVLMA